MKVTRICDLLGIEYPIIQAPMGWVTTADLAAAVSNAGGLGTIGPNAGMTKQSEAGDIEASMYHMREQIRKAKALTQKPFAVNIPIGWGKQKGVSEHLAEVIIEERVPIAVVSMGSSKVYTQGFKEAGIKVLHAVGSVEHATKAQADGVDAVICEGYEAGGHLGGEELTTFVLVPQVADAVEVPVIAGGGIGDARGMVAALALGAEAVYMGTRFLVVEECLVHPSVKQAILEAIDTSTVAFGRRTGLSRCLKNRYTQQHMEMEARGASFEEMRDFERFSPNLNEWRRVPGALMVGDIEDGSVGMGAVAGMITEILSAREVIQSMVRDYDEICNQLQ